MIKNTPSPLVPPAQQQLKKYQKPSIVVITLSNQPALLAQSGIGSNRQGYPKTPQEW
ncbi:MAG: hypothetical protein II939_05865 [Bacteroidales bacterium]|nr:hypothetical protein [Bacteroidales bacterium]